MYGVSTEEAAASASRLFGPCWHHVAAPVVLLTGEVVASVCEDCLAELPASWGCEDCTYVEVRRMGSIRSTRSMAMPCLQHRTN